MPHEWAVYPYLPGEVMRFCRGCNQSEVATLAEPRKTLRVLTPGDPFGRMHCCKVDKVSDLTPSG